MLIPEHKENYLDSCRGTRSKEVYWHEYDAIKALEQKPNYKVMPLRVSSLVEKSQVED